MKETSETSTLKKLFYNHTGKECHEVRLLVPAGSPRRYYRLSAENSSMVGVYGNDLNENKAFTGFTRHFISKGLPVPELYDIDESGHFYLLQDLGDITLKNLTDPLRKGWEFPPAVIPWYKKVIDELVRFQIRGHVGADYSLCLPRSEFDYQSVYWDLNHFKYFFLKLSGIPFHEDLLEKDFHNLSSRIDHVRRDSFLFRDFQSRNIMIWQDKPWFIDYQGGRKGALQYDIASLLFEARTNMPEETRHELLEYYLERVQLEKNGFSRTEFLESYILFALVRQLQAMGAYGLRGWIEKKPLFLQSVPFAMTNLRYFINKEPAKLNTFPELTRILELMTDHSGLNKPLPVPTGNLCVRINSFSYLKTIPDDLTGEGGGFVFDCRGINNPGRFSEYTQLTGLDPAVIEFFETKSEMDRFLKDVFSLIDRTIHTYKERGFKNLQVNFGCTGGQHRSVYAAQKLYEYLEHNPGLTVFIDHRELNQNETGA